MLISICYMKSPIVQIITHLYPPPNTQKWSFADVSVREDWLDLTPPLPNWTEKQQHFSPSPPMCFPCHISLNISPIVSDQFKTRVSGTESYKLPVIILSWEHEKEPGQHVTKNHYICFFVIICFVGENILRKTFIDQTIQNVGVPWPNRFLNLKLATEKGWCRL